MTFTNGGESKSNTKGVVGGLTRKSVSLSYLRLPREGRRREARTMVLHRAYTSWVNSQTNAAAPRAVPWNTSTSAGSLRP